MNMDNPQEEINRSKARIDDRRTECCELFHLNQITITPDPNVQVEYLTIRNTLELYSRASGDVLLVKQQIGTQDVEWLKSFDGEKTVFTMRPNTLESLDALKDCNGIAFLDSIDLNYLHFGEMLIAFGDLSQNVSAPNAVLMQPVRRKDAEEIVKVVSETIDHQDSFTEMPKNSRHTSELESGTQTEKHLVRAALAKAFSDTYTVVDARFSGTSFENKTISLTEFYEKNGIEKGRLRGSWTLFDKQEINKVLDEGIARKAVDAINKEMSLSIPGYGRIVRTENLGRYREGLESIERDYRQYLNGNTQQVGSIHAKNGFTPNEAIENSLSELKRYLLTICPNPDWGLYEKHVECFVDDTRGKLIHFSDKVKLRITESSFKESQWENPDFIESIRKTFATNRGFFSNEFMYLFGRYAQLQSSGNARTERWQSV
jgi:hypothetical protein